MQWVNRETPNMWNVLLDDDRTVWRQTRHQLSQHGDQKNKQIKKREMVAGGDLNSWAGWAVPTWVSERYAGDGAQIDALSVRCPVQLGFEKSRKEGRVTERSRGTSSHTGKKPTEVKSEESGWRQAHTHVETKAFDGKKKSNEDKLAEMLLPERVQ